MSDFEQWLVKLTAFHVNKLDIILLKETQLGLRHLRVRKSVLVDQVVDEFLVVNLGNFVVEENCLLDKVEDLFDQFESEPVTSLVYVCLEDKKDSFY